MQCRIRNSPYFLAGCELGIWRHDGSSCQLISELNAHTIYEDQYGNVWITHRAYGLHQAELSVLEHGSITDGSFLEKELFIGDGMFFGISADKNGTIWVGSLQCVFRYNDRSVTYFREVLKKQKGSPSGLPFFAVKAT